MADQLTGRALDEAAAIAMGWTKPSTRGRCDVCGWPIVPDGEQGCWASNCSMRYRDSNPVRTDQCADYSTDSATIPEMLAWLHQFVRSLNISSYAVAQWHVAIIARLMDDSADVDVVAVGATLNEALARLVVEVARARGQQ